MSIFLAQSHTSERNWTERNGNVEYNDWNGYTNNVENGLSTSPRKDFGSSMRTTTSREDTNWRRRPAKDDDDTWRSTRHGRGKNSIVHFVPTQRDEFTN